MVQKEVNYFISGEQYNNFTVTERTLYVLGMMDSILTMLYMINRDRYQTIRVKVKNMTSSQLRKMLDDYLSKNPQKLNFCVAKSFLFALDEFVQ